MENMIKDLKLDTRSEKSACHPWEANQQHHFLHVGAYSLLHSVRLAAPRKSCWRRATFETIPSQFVKIGCRAEELRTRVRLSFPTNLPHADDLDANTAPLRATIP